MTKTVMSDALYRMATDKLSESLQLFTIAHVYKMWSNEAKREGRRLGPAGLGELYQAVKLAHIHIPDRMAVHMAHLSRELALAMMKALEDSFRRQQKKGKDD